MTTSSNDGTSSSSNGVKAGVALKGVAMRQQWKTQQQLVATTEHAATTGASTMELAAMMELATTGKATMVVATINKNKIRMYCASI